MFREAVVKDQFFETKRSERNVVQRSSICRTGPSLLWILLHSSSCLTVYVVSNRTVYVCVCVCVCVHMDVCVCVCARGYISIFSLFSPI